MTLTAEILRNIGVCVCLLLIGMNAAFMIYDPQPAWRFFLIGKTVLTLYIGIDLWQEDEGYGWRLPLSFIGLTTTTVAIIFLVLQKRWAHEAKTRLET